MSAVPVTPAREGSKGIPRKSARLLARRPVIAHGVEWARLADSVQQRVAAASDDSEIAALGDRAVRGRAEDAS